jgi:hypothetical protein
MTTAVTREVERQARAQMRKAKQDRDAKVKADDAREFARLCAVIETEQKAQDDVVRQARAKAEEQQARDGSPFECSIVCMSPLTRDMVRLDFTLASPEGALKQMVARAMHDSIARLAPWFELSSATVRLRSQGLNPGEPASATQVANLLRSDLANVISRGLCAVTAIPARRK